MHRLRQEDGMTLPELLTSMAIALIVSLATFSLIEVVMKRSGEVGARVETTATARTAMDQITRQLRSQVCAKRKTMGTARSIDAANPGSFTVFTDFTNENYGGGTMPAPDLRTVSWESKVFTETVVKGARDTSDNSVSYTGAGTTRQLLLNVEPLTYVGGDRKKPLFFRFYKFPTPPNGEELPANVNHQPDIPILAPTEYRNLTTAELESVAKIEVAFRVVPRSGNPDGATTLQNEIYVRTADPNAQTPKPTCLTY
jgi:prepilin-type N-terminal cleavage/methylation domain-containing protein